ncbi:MAG: thiolase family protein, partial [Candidatus Marinimicrobia bacterium]|nr:thiolase family protein [Candidatus Neomarinimicrobiota bacterium]
MDSQRSAVIAGARRTPIGTFEGSLSGISAVQLGATAVKASLKTSSLAHDAVDEVIMGNVLPAGLGQAPARQTALAAGLPESTECLTVNKMCGSGLKAVMLAAQAVQLGDADAVVAGGMENMSRAPYLLPKGRKGYRLGHGEVLDSVVVDGLWDVYNDKHMGSCAETCNRKHNFSRAEQDEFAKESYSRAQRAQEDGSFAAEIIPVKVTLRKGTVTVSEDEEPKRANFDKMTRLKPAFEKNGSVTAANASKINDGAAAMVILAEDAAAELGVTPTARIVAQASIAQEPEWFTTAPISAIRKVLDRASMSLADIDLFEINEAFSTVALVAMRELDVSHDIVNVRGGAVALGHPIGASGARILVTL